MWANDSGSKRPLRWFFTMMLTFCVVSVANVQVFTGYAPILAKIHETEYHRRASTNAELQSAARIAIVQYFDGELTPGFAASRQLMCEYAKLHGYAIYFFNETTVKVNSDDLKELNLFRDTKSHWMKPFYLSQMVRDTTHEWFAYFDADIVVTNMGIPLETWIDVGVNNASDLIISDDPSGINNGVFFQKASEWTLDFNRIWWSERQSSRVGGDNWPFMAALLTFWANSSDYNYKGECSMAENVRMESWDNFYPCYKKHLEAMGRRSTHPQGCTSEYQHPCGSAKVGDPHIVAVWELNKGNGFGGKNSWSEGSFIMHFAGRGNRDKMLLQHATAYATRTLD